MFNQELTIKATKVLQNLRQNNSKLTCAESCTGGLLSALFTSISGASDVFDRGFVTYSNDAKNEMLNVDIEILEEFGAVSEEVAIGMAIGALKNSQANIAVAITGIAGPKSDDTKKPVGLVYVAIAARDEEVRVQKFNFAGDDRDQVRLSTISATLEMLSS
jgi:nicotinamide-nucleotide amidase